MTDITKIPQDDLLADRLASVMDRDTHLVLIKSAAYISPEMLIPLRRRADGNQRIIDAIDAELARREVLTDD